VKGDIAGECKIDFYLFSSYTVQKAENLKLPAMIITF
jgi:hypothetical protein